MLIVSHYIFLCSGLINEIMSKGRRITYDELCNAVLPVCFFMGILGFLLQFFLILVIQEDILSIKMVFLFVFQHWNNLRKHNGDRYAYTSHSQAVLDCLRNRPEWARLVDRGPKVRACSDQINVFLSFFDKSKKYISITY